MAINKKNLSMAARSLTNGGFNGTAPAAETDYGQLANKYMTDYENSRFNYDFNTDPVFQAAKQTYINQGRLAAKNVAAQAARYTGGYGNSYGAAAAQQQFNEALNNVNNIIPELQNAAYSRYQNEQAKKQNLAQWYLQNSRYQKEDERYEDELRYNRGRDSLSDQRYADELQYNRGRDKLSDERYADETAYNRKTAEENNALQKAQLAASLGDFSLLRNLGYNTANAEKEYAAKLAGSTGGGSYGRSSGGTGASSKKSSGLTIAQYNTLRKNCQKAGSDGELKSYLNGLARNGYIDKDMYNDLWTEFARNPGTLSSGEAASAKNTSSKADAIYKTLSSIYVSAKTAEQRNVYMANKVSQYVEDGEITEEEGLDILDRLGVKYSLYK